MIWLLENELFDNLDELKSEIVKQGHEYVEAKYIPFGGGIEIIKGSIYNSGRIFAYGSLQFIQQCRKNLGPWVINGLKIYQNNNLDIWCNLPQFKCSYYYPRLSKYLLNSESCFLPFGQLQDKKEWIFQTFGIDDCIFMRPDSGFKQFTGQVYQKQYWDSFLRLSNIALQPEDLVVVARPQRILKEFRVIIGPRYGCTFNSDGTISNQWDDGQRVVTLCRTHRDGKLNEYPDCNEYQHPTDPDILRAKDYVNEILTNICYEPDPMWVIDIAMTHDLKLYVLEVNSMSCSGYYKCSMEEIVKSVAEYICGYSS